MNSVTNTRTDAAGIEQGIIAKKQTGPRVTTAVDSQPESISECPFNIDALERQFNDNAATVAIAIAEAISSNAQAIPSNELAVLAFTYMLKGSAGTGIKINNNQA
jgi:Holliday junction resolvasome RuvABC endonuclease subunit